MEFHGRGTHTGPLTSPAGSIPPTGRSVDIPFIQFLEFESGKIARARLYFDLSTMMRQLEIQPGMMAASD
jgi:predicted ester cyclase